MLHVFFVVLWIAARNFVEAENNDCIIPIEDEQINLNELNLPSGYFIESGHRKFVINICGAAPKCGLDVAACEIMDNNNVINLGYYSKLTVLTKYSPNIGLKYLKTTNKDLYTTIEFKCNRHIENYIFKFVPEKKAGNHHRFTFESAVFCVHRQISCVVQNVYDSTQIDLGALYKPYINWKVKNSPANSDIYLNICGDLNPIGVGQKSRGAQVSLVDASKNVKSLGLLSEQMIIDNGFVSANFSDGFECSKNKYSSTRIDFLCSFIEKGPELISYTICNYAIRWFTPAACPHKVSTYSSCNFNDDILGEIDLTKLYQKSYEKHISADDSLLKFNICGSLDNCNGRKDVSFCLVKNNTEMVFGKTSNTIISTDGFMRMKFQGDLCSSNHVNRSVTLNFICDYSQPIREDIQIIAEHKIIIDIYTHFACPSSNEMRCKTNPVNGSYYDLSNFARLSNHNLEVIDVDDRNLTYVLRICQPVIYSKNSMCAQQTICVRNSSEPNLYESFQMLGRQPENLDIYTKNNSVILRLKGRVCRHTIQQANFITEIEFRCSKTLNMTPILKSKSNCTYIFLWETEQACDIIQEEDTPVSIHDTNFSTKSDNSAKIDINNIDESIIKIIKSILVNEHSDKDTQTESPDNINKTESMTPKNKESVGKEEEESRNRIIKEAFQENEPHKNLVNTHNLNKVDREIKKNEETNLQPLKQSKDNESPGNVETNEDLIEAKLNTIDHKILRSLFVPINMVNSSGIHINNCTVTDQTHKFNMNSLSRLVNITSKNGTHYSINICNNTAGLSCQNPFCKESTLTDLFLVPNNRFISMSFSEKTKCNNGYYKSILFLKCSDDPEQPLIIKEDECSVHFEWKNKGTCSFFDHTEESQTMSGATTAAIVVPVILVFLSVCVFLFFFWRNKQNTTTNGPPLKCYGKIHYSKVKDSAKIV